VRYRHADPGTGHGALHSSDRRRLPSDREVFSSAQWEAQRGGWFLVGQIVPPVVSLIPESEVASLHCIVGSCGLEPRMGEEEKVF
jgi:hypothetical protein